MNRIFLLLLILFVGCGSQKSKSLHKELAQKTAIAQKQVLKAGSRQYLTDDFFRSFISELNLQINPLDSSYFTLQGGDYKYIGRAPLSINYRRADTVYRTREVVIRDTVVVRDTVFVGSALKTTTDQTQKSEPKPARNWRFLSVGLLIGGVAGLLLRIYFKP